MPRLNRLAVRDRLDQLDWSIPFLAAKTNIPKATLRNVVTGRDPIRMGRVYRISRELDIDISELVANPPKGLSDERKAAA